MGNSGNFAPVTFYMHQMPSTHGGAEYQTRIFRLQVQCSADWAIAVSEFLEIRNDLDPKEKPWRKRGNLHPQDF